MTADPMQRARELLAAEYGAGEPVEYELEAQMMLSGIKPAIRCVAALLTREEEVRGEERERCIAQADHAMKMRNFRRVDRDAIAAAIRSAPLKDET